MNAAEIKTTIKRISSILGTIGDTSDLNRRDEQMIVAEGFSAWAERDNKVSNGNNIGPAIKVAVNPAVLVLSGMGLSDHDADLILQEVNDKDLVEVIHLSNNNLTQLPNVLGMFRNLRMVCVDDNKDLKTVWNSARNCCRAMKTISASGTSCSMDEVFDCQMIGIELGF